jgi:sugar lactone lactonase YvrE
MAPAYKLGNYYMRQRPRSVIGGLYIFLCLGWPVYRVAAQSVYPAPYTVATLAGVPPGSADGPVANARFNLPQGVATDSAGNVYVADTGNSTIRKISAAGITTTLAGTPGVTGYADGVGGAAQFSNPAGLAVDPSGNIYVADYYNSVIRKITPDGTVTTFAGKGGNGGSSDGLAIVARFFGPVGVAIDTAGNLYVADSNNQEIRKISTTGIVSTLAGAAAIAGSLDGTGAAARFNNPQALAVDAAGNVYVADWFSDAIRKISPAGVVTTLAGNFGVAGGVDGTGLGATFSDPDSVAVDGAGNVYVSEWNGDTIRKITATGTVTTLAGMHGVIGSLDGVGTAARFSAPESIAVNGTGQVYVADGRNNTIRVIAPSGAVTTLAGSPPGNVDGLGNIARFNSPIGAAVDGGGNVFVADFLDNTIRRISTYDNVTTVAGSAGLSGSADGPVSVARFNHPAGLGIDGLGNLYVADEFNNTIRKITPAGLVSTVAGLAGFSGTADGTGSAARFLGPTSVQADTAGNLYVTDRGNHTIRKIAPGGQVSTLAGVGDVSGSTDGLGSAALFDQPSALVLDQAGNLYVSDTGNETIRKILPSGLVSTLAGVPAGVGSTDGTGSGARFSGPFGLAIDAAGNLYLADEGNSEIRKITSAGVVTTVAGKAVANGGVDGTGNAARFNYPEGIAIDGKGTLFVVDTNNSTIRYASASPPPLIVSQPIAVTAVTGQTATFRVAASSSGAIAYQWEVNGVPIPGATDSYLVVPNVTAASTGAYACLVANAFAATLSSPVSLSLVSATGTGRLVNLSVLNQAGKSQILTVGFVTGGAGAAGLQPLLFRATGPALATFGIQSVQPDPTLTVYAGSAIINANDNWGTPSSNQASLALADSAVFAFPLTDPNSLDAALLTSLAPGNYTVQISGNGAAVGTALAEVYDATPTGSITATSPRLVNLSSTTQISAGGSLTAGFVIGGTASKTLLIRATGPALAGFGVAGTIPDPQLVLYAVSGAQDYVLASNAGWAGDSQIAAVSNSVYAFPLTNPSSQDSALLVTLPPGSYTVVANSVSNAGGVALIEVYEVP